MNVIFVPTVHHGSPECCLNTVSESAYVVAMVMTIEAHVFGTIVLCMIIMCSCPERALVMDIAFVTTTGATIDDVHTTENMTVFISANMAAAEHAVLTAAS